MKQSAVLKEYEVKSNKITKPLKIGLIADIHERKNEDSAALLKSAAPDLTAIAGDTLERRFGEDFKRRKKTDPIKMAIFTTAFYFDTVIKFITRNKNYADPENAYRFLREAGRLSPTYMSLGNHEERLSDEDYQILAENKITLLDNSDVTAEINGQRLIIGGLSSFCDEEWLGRFSQKKGFKLLLCHHPEYYDELIKDKDIDLVLTGHNHGGQFRFFGKGLLSSTTGLFPKYDRGLFDGRLVVSAGCSNTTVIPRFGNPREVVIVNLLPE